METISNGGEKRMKQLFDNENLRRLDESIMLRVQERRRRWLNPVMIAVTELGGGVIWWAWYGFIFMKNHDKQALLYFTVSFFAGWLLSSQVLKRVFGRPRAYDAMEEVIPLIRRPKDLAFPSAHAACAFSAACAIAVTRTPVEGIIALILAVLVGFSRIYVGVHYLTDVLGGAVTGILCAAAALPLL